MLHERTIAKVDSILFQVNVFFALGSFTCPDEARVISSISGEGVDLPLATFLGRVFLYFVAGGSSLHETRGSSCLSTSAACSTRLSCVSMQQIRIFSCRTPYLRVLNTRRPVTGAVAMCLAFVNIANGRWSSLERA